jgi:thiol-disulfide isomerase/thioredoxin
MLVHAVVVLLAICAGCGKSEPAKQPPPGGSGSSDPGSAAVAVPAKPATPAKPDATTGTWYRAALTYKDLGELAFFLQLPEPGTDGQAFALNRDERSDFAVKWNGPKATITGPWTYTSVIEAELATDKSSLTGTWTRDTPLWGKVVRDFKATRVDAPDPKRRYASNAPPVTNVAGSWKFQFDTHKDGKGILEQTADGVVSGFVRPGQLGDVRVLGGNLSGKQLSLSHFNGNSANLILAEVSPDGTTMKGTMSMQNVWNEKFTAKKVADFEHVRKVKLKKGKTSVTLKGLDKYKGKPVLAMVFATWCPACNDATPYIKKLYETYHPKGFEVLGVSYDLSTDAKATQVALDAYRDKYKLPWELTSVLSLPESWQASMPPEIEGWDGLPILMLIKPDGTVHTIYGGWFGPTTGADGDQLRAWFESEVKTLVGG